MNRTWVGAAGLLGLAAFAAWEFSSADENLGPRAPADRPVLALVTSLPLIFGERFGLEGGGSPTLARLEQRYRMEPIGVADAASLKDQRLLLMAHPRAQPAEVLVELDQWVRGGGRLLLLADPRLDWPSERPMGDLLRPPPSFADTGLLGHWGLGLGAPINNGSAGVLSLTREGTCEILQAGLIARCTIGSGRATVIADADFLNVDDPSSAELDLLIDELNRLESR